MGKSQKMTATGQTQPVGRGQHDDQGSRQVQAVGTGTELRISWSERDLYWANTARPKAGMEGSPSFAQKLRPHLEELLDVKPSSRHDVSGRRKFFVLEKNHLKPHCSKFTSAGKQMPTFITSNLRRAYIRSYFILSYFILSYFNLGLHLDVEGIAEKVIERLC